MGGEKQVSGFASDNAEGSPPRGRGKAQDIYTIANNLGITPAWAGKRVFGQVAVKLHKDHPRVGGEKTKKIP